MAINDFRNQFGEIPIGVTVGYNSANTPSVPTNYLNCDGSSLSTTTYEILFAVIAYTYGGSGSNFTLPTISDTIIRYQ